MRIKTKPVNEVEFYSVKSGTVFRSPNWDTLYMKIDICGSGDEQVNAITLDEGETLWFADDENIILVEGCFVEEE